MRFGLTFALLGLQAAANPLIERAACNADNCARLVTGTSSLAGIPSPSIRKSHCSSFLRKTVTGAGSTTTSTHTTTPVAVTSTVSTTLTSTTTSTPAASTSTVIVTASTTTTTTPGAVTVTFPVTETDTSTVTPTSTSTISVTTTTTTTKTTYTATVTSSQGGKKKRQVSSSSIPAYVGSSCGTGNTALSRYSSACSCYGAIPATTTVAGPSVTSTVTVAAPAATLTVTTTAGTSTVTVTAPAGTSTVTSTVTTLTFTVTAAGGTSTVTSTIATTTSTITAPASITSVTSTVATSTVTTTTSAIYTFYPQPYCNSPDGGAGDGGCNPDCYCDLYNADQGIGICDQLYGPDTCGPSCTTDAQCPVGYACGTDGYVLATCGSTGPGMGWCVPTTPCSSSYTGYNGPVSKRWLLADAM